MPSYYTYYLCAYNEFMISCICSSKLVSDTCIFQLSKGVQTQNFVLSSTYKDLSWKAISEMRLSICRNYTLCIFFHWEDYVWKIGFLMWRIIFYKKKRKHTQNILVFGHYLYLFKYIYLLVFGHTIEPSDLDAA